MTASQHPARVIDACQQRRWYHQVQGEGRDAEREQAIALARIEADTRPEALAEVTRSPLDPARGVVIGVGLTLLTVLGIVAGVVLYRWLYPY